MSDRIRRCKASVSAASFIMRSIGLPHSGPKRESDGNSSHHCDKGLRNSHRGMEAGTVQAPSIDHFSHRSRFSYAPLPGRDRVMLLRQPRRRAPNR